MISADRSAPAPSASREGARTPASLDSFEGQLAEMIVVKTEGNFTV